MYNIEIMFKLSKNFEMKNILKFAKKSIYIID